ncbi:MAG: GntR family transcriptional regulator [Nitratireductor sp.]
MKSTQGVLEEHQSVEGLSRSSYLFEQIHELLWHKILVGEIIPRQRLKDVEWAKKLGVSRTPVREAMRKMQQEGILIPLSIGGYEVRSVTLQDFLGLYQCRAVLEGLAAKEAPGHFTKKTEATFHRLFRKIDAAIERQDLDEAFELKTAFHNELIELSGNTHLIGLFQSMTKLILFYRSALLNRVKARETSKQAYIDGLKASQETHRAIIATIVAGDGDCARRLIEQHLLDAADDIASRLIAR